MYNTVDHALGGGDGEKESRALQRLRDKNLQQIIFFQAQWMKAQLIQEKKMDSALILS